MNEARPSLLERVLARFLGERGRTAFRKVGWTAMAQALGMVIRLGSNLTLTRLLAPEIYGILGTALAVLTTLEWLSDVGVTPALVRHPKGESPAFLLTGWWIQAGRGLLLAIAAAACAWPMAEVNQKPELLMVLLVFSLRPFLLGLMSPATPALRKRLDYRALFFIEVGMTFFGTVASIACAFWLRSIWAIVIGTMVGAGVKVLLSYVFAPMLPRWCWDKEAAKEIYGFGQQIFVNTLVMALWLNLDRLLGLRFIPEKAMGHFFIAWNLANVAESLITRACDVYFSMLSREPPGEAREAWHRRITWRLTSLGFPALTLGAVAGPLAVWILYDPRYMPAGVVLGILCARLIMRSLGQVQFQLMLVRGNIRPATRCYVVAFVLLAALLVPLAQAYGIIGLALCNLLSTTVLTGLQTFLFDRQILPRSRRPFLFACLWLAGGLGLLYGLSFALEL